jgi:hypothetical protein
MEYFDPVHYFINSPLGGYKLTDVSGLNAEYMTWKQVLDAVVGSCSPDDVKEYIHNFYKFSGKIHTLPGKIDGWDVNLE